MNRSIRHIALVALAASIAACSQAAGSVGDAPAPPATVAPATTVPSASPSASPIASLVVLPSANPIPSPVATPSPTEPATDPANVLAAHGIGPYVVGARLAALESQGLVANVEPSFHCTDEYQNAQATGNAGQLHLSFLFGRLIDVHTASSEFVTPSGAKVGMPVTELQRIYGTRGTMITGVSGNEALSVHVPDTHLGIVFFLDATNTTVWSMSAGEVERLDIAAVVGEGC